MQSVTRIGREIAGYRLQDVLGRGGMSVVYLAEHTRLGRKVALKLLAPELARDDAFRERFMRESRLAAELEHPNIVSVYDAGEAEGYLYIAMRYVGGTDLGEILKRSGPFGIGRSVFLIEQIASGLDYAHARGLVHRDVKPANVLIVEQSDRAYLTDFGIAKRTTSAGLTKTGYFLGTVDYCAPEQIEGRQVDARTDVYALGCLLYACLTGMAPYERDAEVAVMHAHLIEAPPKVTAVQPELPSELDRVIATAMAKDMDARFGSCGELASATAVASRGGRFSTHAPPISVDESERKREHELPAGTVLAPPEPPPRAASQAAPPLQASAPPPREVAPPPETVPEVPPPEAAPPTRTPPPWSPASIEQAGFGRRRRSRLLVALLIAVLAAAVATGLSIFFVTRGHGGGGAAVASQAGLVGLIPTPLLKNSCHIQATPLLAGAVQSAVCTPPATAGARALPFYPGRWEVSIFPNAKSLAAAYASLRQQNDVGADFGQCNGVTWAGEGLWLHNPTGGVAKPGGRRFCYFDGNVAVIVWTHEKLGQASHIDILGAAREGGSDHPSLFGWWRFWHHRIGKCQQQGCTAKLPSMKASSHSTSMTHMHRANKMVGGTPMQQLTSLIPNPISRTCKSAPMTEPAMARMTCVFDEQAKYGRTEQLDLRLYHNQAEASAALNSAVRSSGVPAGAGPCTAVRGSGRGVWYHDPTTRQDRGGRYVCYLTSNESQSVIAWDVEKTNVVAIAVCACAHPKLYQFWSFWVHELGVA